MRLSHFLSVHEHKSTLQNTNAFAKCRRRLTNLSLLANSFSNNDILNGREDDLNVLRVGRTSDVRTAVAKIHERRFSSTNNNDNTAKCLLNEFARIFVLRQEFVLDKLDSFVVIATALFFKKIESDTNERTLTNENNALCNRRSSSSNQPIDKFAIVRIWFGFCFLFCFCNQNGVSYFGNLLSE
jgi:hypothetical protein